MRYLMAIAMLLTAGCGESTREFYERKEREAWVAPCSDMSVLLATTAGSPSSFTCPNRLHKMRVQVATAPSNEEAAALVFCECRPSPATSDTKGEER